MRRRLLINLLLLALVAGLGWLAYRDYQTPPAAGLPTLTHLRPEAITRVRIQGPQGQQLLLAREQGLWRMEEPYRVAAAGERVARLLAIAETPLYRRFPAREADLPGYGLAPPRLVLTLDGVEIGLGTTEPLQFRRYVLVEGAVGLIEDLFLHQLQAPAEDFVSRQVLPAGSNPDAARSRVRPLDLSHLLALQADRVEPLRDTPEGVELVVALPGTAGDIPLVLAPDRRRLARPDLGLVYGFYQPLPLRQPALTTP